MGTAHYWLTRLVFQRALAFVYLIGFLIAAFQFRPLVGEHGLLPIRLFLKQASIWQTPSLFWIDSSDKTLAFAAWSGVLLSVIALSGLSESFGFAVSALTWGLLWVVYLSFVNTGQTFYGFGWESLLLETGFLAVFMGSRNMAPSVILIWLLRWVLFRLMFGAGMIKLRGDACWRDLTCMFYHYETQPLPNPLSWYFHHLPKIINKAAVLFTHFVELVVPFAYFAPRPICYVAGALTIVFQGTLILSGNLSWLNYITIVLCIPCFDDAFFDRLVWFSAPLTSPMTTSYKVVLGALTAGILFLSIRPTVNLFSRRQMMNASFEPFHLVNTYGAFGSIGRDRTEVILEGTDDTVVTAATQWKEYAFKAKPGDVNRTPPIVSPYHYRLDWQMWFAAMSSYRSHPWILNLVAKLLAGDKPTLGLMGPNPFPEKPPKYIRAQLYLYQFTKAGDKSGAWWKRTYLEPYLPPLSLDNESFLDVLRNMEWI